MEQPVIKINAFSQCPYLVYGTVHNKNQANKDPRNTRGGIRCLEGLRTYDTFPTFSLEILFQPPPFEEFLEINFQFSIFTQVRM
jgi:hypothetical protein